MLHHTDTIAAMATASGPGAIAVVRISGPEAFGILERLSRRGREEFAPRQAVYCRILSEPGEHLDSALVTLFPGQASFTGEDVAEISCHGGYAVVRAVLGAVLTAGARPAEPGEFTRRAFLNGKLDLAQAEGINQLIRARTRTQLAAANQTLGGALSDRVRAAAGELNAAAAALEASIDFPEDVDEPDRDELAGRLDAVAAGLAEAEELAGRGQMLSAGIRLAIVGRPNVGKSSILNLLAGRQRAIVSDIPGTTRDFLEETVEVGGLPVVAVDTAGIRETEDPIEQEGARRAAEIVDQADVVLVVLDAGAGRHEGELALEGLGGERAVRVWNKVDLAPEGFVQPEDEVALCALTGEGLAELEARVLEALGAGAGYFDEAIAASERQVAALREARENVEEAAASVRSPWALDLAAVQIQAARQRLASITGEDVTESLLDSIFGAFCIGK